MYLLSHSFAFCSRAFTSLPQDSSTSLFSHGLGFTSFLGKDIVCLAGHSMSLCSGMSCAGTFLLHSGQASVDCSEKR